MNFWGFDPSVYPHFEEHFREFARERAGDPKAEFFIPLAIDRVIRRKKASVTVLPTDETWFGMTYREDKKAVTERILELVHRGIYPQELWS